MDRYCSEKRTPLQREIECWGKHSSRVYSLILQVELGLLFVQSFPRSSHTSSGFLPHPKNMLVADKLVATINCPDVWKIWWICMHGPLVACNGLPAHLASTQYSQEVLFVINPKQMVQGGNGYVWNIIQLCRNLTHAGMITSANQPGYLVQCKDKHLALLLLGYMIYTQEYIIFFPMTP